MSYIVLIIDILGVIILCICNYKPTLLIYNYNIQD